jgi:hypothetical protein
MIESRAPFRCPLTTPLGGPNLGGVLTEPQQRLLRELMADAGGEEALKRELSRVSVLLQQFKVRPAILIAVLGGGARVHQQGVPLADQLDMIRDAFSVGWEVAGTARQPLIAPPGRVTQ